MSAPLVPSPLDYIGRNQFAFYPGIRHADPNVWLLGSSSWGEVQVINARTGRDLWVPRRYIGAVSESLDSLVVGLTQQLHLRNDEVVPSTNCRIIQMPSNQMPSSQMPSASNVPVSRTTNGRADVIGIRLEPKTPRAFQKTPFRVGIAVLFVAGLLALVESASR